MKELTKIKLSKFVELFDVAIEDLRNEREFCDNDEAYDDLYNFELEISKESWIEFTKKCLGGKYE